MRKICPAFISPILLLLLYLIIAPGLACKQSDSFPDRLHLLTLLENRDFDTLDKRLNELQKASEKDVTKESHVSLAFETFSESKPNHESILSHWVATRPQSYAAHLASAEYFWHFVQTQWVNRSATTSPEQRKRLDHGLAQVTRHAKGALALHPQLIEAYYLLMRVALLQNDTISEQAYVRQALQLSPASFRIRSTHMQALSPFRGGSREAMQYFAADSQALVAKNPRLKILLGFVPWEDGLKAARSGDYQGAVNRFSEALTVGPYATFYMDRAKAYCLMNDPANALADTSAALQLYPQAPEALGNRARALLKLGRVEEANADLELATKLDPGDQVNSDHQQEGEAENFPLKVCEDRDDRRSDRALKLFDRIASIDP